MRNPFARLAKRDTARPSLRERAATLKASAARVIRRKPMAMPAVDLLVSPLADTASPDLTAMIAEWAALAEKQEDVSLSDEESGAIGERWSALQAEICQFPARSLADLCAKAPLYKYERNEERSSMPRRAWESVLRDIEALSAAPELTPGADPILAMIEECRRRLRMSDAAFAIPQDPNTMDPPQEQGEAQSALWSYIDSTILKTVPLTAAGCRELARFANEYAENQGVPISDDEQAITSLIAQSPLITTRPMPLPEADGSGFVTYKDAVGRNRREPVAYWIAATALDLDGIARREVSRQFNAACNDLSREEGDALYDQLRKEHRIDALHDLAFRSDRVP